MYVYESIFVAFVHMSFHTMYCFVMSRHVMLCHAVLLHGNIREGVMRSIQSSVPFTNMD